MRGQRLVLIPFCLAWIYIQERLSGHYGVRRLSVRPSVCANCLWTAYLPNRMKCIDSTIITGSNLKKNHWWHYQRLNPAAGRWNHNLLVINAEIHCHVTRRDWSLRTALYKCTCQLYDTPPIPPARSVIDRCASVMQLMYNWDEMTHKRVTSVTDNWGYRQWCTCESLVMTHQWWTLPGV